MRLTQTDRVLIGSDFIYWGGSGPPMPQQFVGVICDGRGHRANFDPAVEAAFIQWLRNLKDRRYQGEPLDWSKKP
jgi:hypothetical protein